VAKPTVSEPVEITPPMEEVLLETRNSDFTLDNSDGDNAD
jgi:hypothetical protein